MKTITRTQILRNACIPLTLGLIGCGGMQSHSDRNPLRIDAGRVEIRAASGVNRPPFAFSAQDNQLLDEIERSTFMYFWSAVSPETGMVFDRTSSDVISVSGVGFQLSALPIGVERGWISRQEGFDRAHLILTWLAREPSNRKAGLFYHFINPHDASARRVGRELVVSTVDSALLFSGMLVAGQYFGGDVEYQANRLFEDADWSFFLAAPGESRSDAEFLGLGWKPDSDDDPTGEGELLPYFWIDSGDEHRLTTLLAACSPNPDFRVPSSVYWGLRRQLGWHHGQGYVVWFPYSGALFTSFFAHCFIDYSTLGIDDPRLHNQAHRARVDWWENSRRMVNLHRDRAIENPHGLVTLGSNAWGFSASDGPDGYLVSSQFPTPVEMIDAAPDDDFADYRPETNWGEGVIAPYASGASIMFEPALAIDALRYARHLSSSDGGGGVWHEDWGFADSFRLDEYGHIDWIAEDFVAISQGPLIIGIENARTGLIWELFMSHDEIRRGIEELGLSVEP